MDFAGVCLPYRHADERSIIDDRRGHRDLTGRVEGRGKVFRGIIA